MDYAIKDGRVWFQCGCNFLVTGKPLFPKSDFPAIKFNPDTFYPDHDINFLCEHTWDLFATGRTKGIFQLESPLGRQWSKKLKPRSLEHLSALGAILRPGTLKALDDKGISMTAHYCMRKNVEEEATCFHPAMEPALLKTYFIMIYQEQGMKITRDLAGFNEQEADMLRKAMGKKLPEEMAKVRKMFIEGCKKMGIVTDKEAEQIFDWIEKGQRYLFNKCISADTIILKASNGGRLPNGGYTVEHMYKIRNDINYAKQCGQLSLYKKWKLRKDYGKGKSLFPDGKIKPNTILDIRYSGVQPTYKVTLSDGRSLSTTLNHKFPTPDGEKLLMDIKVGDNIFVQGDWDKSSKKYGWSNTTIPELREVAKNREHDHKQVGFMTGQDNPGYINGEYTKFVNNKSKLEKKCYQCNKTNCRIETHHIDGNRLNNEENNLTNLCVSCHKKVEYANGRVKWGQKGYFPKTMEIISIEFDKMENVYDVEMENPAHNLLVNDEILTSNSHSVGYGILGYVSAYTKVHFPLNFYTSYLLNSQGEGDSFEEIQQLVDDAKLADISILPPDITRLKSHFNTDGQNVYFGLSNVKNIGLKVMPTIKELLAGKNIDINTVPWYDFLIDILDNLSITVVHRMIETGALERFGMSRKRMIAEYDIWHSKLKEDTEKAWILERRRDFSDICAAMKAMARTRKEGGGCFSAPRVAIVQDLIKSLESPPSPFEDSPDWIAWCEKEYLGIPITYTELDKYDVSRASHTCKDIVKGHKAYAVLGVQIKQVKTTKTKKGKSPGSTMAFLSASDATCTLDNIVVFSNTWKEFSHLLTENNIVFISGKMTREGSFQVEKVYPIED